jgi:WD40 repeat protein
MLAAARSEDIYLWNLQDASEPSTQLAGRGTQVNDLCFSPSEPRLATAGEDGVVRIWNTNTGREMLALHEHTGPVVGVAFSPDGWFLASISRTGDIVVRDGRPDTISGEN